VNEINFSIDYEKINKNYFVVNYNELMPVFDGLVYALKITLLDFFNLKKKFGSFKQISYEELEIYATEVCFYIIL
jgi:hypothetical protein